MEILYNIFKIVLTITATLILLVVIYSLIAGFISTIKKAKIKKEFNKNSRERRRRKKNKKNHKR